MRLCSGRHTPTHIKALVNLPFELNTPLTSLYNSYSEDPIDVDAANALLTGLSPYTLLHNLLNVSITVGGHSPCDQILSGSETQWPSRGIL